MIPVLLGLLIMAIVYSVLIAGSLLIQKLFPNWFLFEYYSWFGRFVMNPLMLAMISLMVGLTVSLLVVMAHAIGLSVIQGLS
jgi:hypothetical protein